MNRCLWIMALVIAPALTLIGCGGDDHHDHAHTDKGADKHGGKEPNDHGEAHALAAVELDGVKVSGTLFGHVEAGEEAHMDLTIQGATPTAVRLWIGTEDRTTSVVSKAESSGKGTFHAHADAPKPLPEGAAIWVEVDTGDNTVLVSLAIPKE